MNTTTKNLLIISAIAGISITATQAATLASTGNTQLGSATNWSPSQTPSSGNDTLNVGTGTLTINSTWTIGSGQAINNTGGNIRLANGGNLIVASGGDLNSVGFYESGATAASGRSLTFEAGSSASSSRYITGQSASAGDSDWTTKWIANSSGVTTFDIANDWRIRGSAIDVDLTSYDSSNGLSLTLATYGSLTDGPFNNVNITGIGGATWTEGVDYTFDLGDGSADSLTLTIVPEPSSTALLGLGALALIMRRHK